jgi:hypothetical protein
VVAMRLFLNFNWSLLLSIRTTFSLLFVELSFIFFWHFSKREAIEIRNHFGELFRTGNGHVFSRGVQSVGS